MRRTRQQNTDIEAATMSVLDAMGHSYQLDRAAVEGVRARADLIFDEAHVAVFIDGCFWHGCPIHGTWPKSNEEFWREKINANMARDLRTNLAYEAAGWTVVRIWGHEDPRAGVLRIAEACGWVGRLEAGGATD
jgi:DNA mismatch endonuclease, patch repair protein